jgi:hypothetical protein
MDDAEKLAMQQRLGFLVNEVGALALEWLKTAAPGLGYGFVFMLIPPGTGEPEIMPAPMSTNVEPENLYATLHAMTEQMQQANVTERMRLVRPGTTS